MPADLAELLHRAAPEPAAPVDPERLWRAGRRRRYRQVAATVSVLAAAVLWAVDTGAGEPDEEVVDVTTADLTHTDDPAQGFGVEYPSTWQRATTSLTPGRTNPVEILSLGTGDLAEGSRGCPQLPTGALEAMSPTDAFVTVQEELSAPAALRPDRPDRFPPAGSEDGGEVPLCLTHPPTFGDWDLRFWWIRFQDAGRGFYVLVAIGDQATDETWAETWAILDSLRFDPVPTSAASRTVISGTLRDGLPWLVRNDAVHGLCVKLGEADLGCDDEGPVIGPGADPATPRLALAPSARSFESGSLVYGFLPAGATRVELVYDDGPSIPTGLVIEPDERFWAAPVDPDDNPDGVSYRDDGGGIWLFGLRSR
jgi:hypothetical protein